MSTITSKTVAVGLADINEIVLTETRQTAIVFNAQIHDGGVRGTIIRYKKDSNGERETPVSVDFRRLHADDGIEIELNTEAILKLQQHIEELQTIIDVKGVQYGTHRYRVTRPEDIVITDQNKAAIIQKLIDANLENEIWEEIIQSDSDLATQLANSKLYNDRKGVLCRFEEMLNNESLSENDWQDFFEDNTWIFGFGLRYQILRIVQSQPQYGGATINGRGGQRGDFLSATEADTKFTCLVEIKKPTTALLQNEQYRRGAWGISKELSGAISQVQVNCAQWEIFGANAPQNRELLGDIYTVSPKGIVVVGKTNELDSHDKRNSFERFRREIRNPEIITFDELYERAKFIVEGSSAQSFSEDNVLPFWE